MKWIRRILVGLLVVIVIGAGALYGWTHLKLTHQFEPVGRSLQLSSQPDVIAHGERMATVLGCYHGCHGAEMEGGPMFESWLVGSIVAPNLTRAIDQYSTPEMEAIVRQGVRPDGRSVLVMPSSAFDRLTDRDLAAVFSFIATYPQQEDEPGRSSYGPLARYLIATGEVPLEAAEAREQPWAEGFRNDSLALGEYLATVACSECHGRTLEGKPGFTPTLKAAQAYSQEDFQRLMSDGIGLGDRELGLMSEVARHRFSRLEDDEVRAVYLYLQTL